MKQGAVLWGLSTLLFEAPYALAADKVATTDPEPDQYVRVCEAMGAGFFHLPGSKVCLQISGSVTYDLTMGDDVYTGEPLGRLDHAPSTSLSLDARSDSDLGMLRSYLGFDFDQDSEGESSAELADAFIELGGLLVGASSSQFDGWLGSAGNVLSDDVIPYAGGMTNQISYTARFSDGFSAMIGGEQGTKDDGGEEDESGHDYTIDGYLPHLVGGLKLERNWGTISTVVGYDVVIEEVAAKVRLDLKLGEIFSAFIMGGYQSDPEKPNYFGPWDGTYAAWGGISASISPTLTFNSQVAYEDSGTYALAVNLDYEAVPGFMITPELNYTSFGRDSAKSGDALGGLVSVVSEF